MRRLGLLFLLTATAALGQSRTVTRASSAPALALTTTAPSGTPKPELPGCPSCSPVRTNGQSSTKAGALHLIGCTGYRITICAVAPNTLSGAGSIDVYYWPDFMPASVAITTWPKNPGIAEAVTGTGQCQTFPDRSTYGASAGWIYAAPNAVTTSGATTITVLVEATCAT